MDTCDRYALHEAYKRRLKSMIALFMDDCVRECNEEIDFSQSKQLINFIDKWVEGHCKPAKFEEE